MPFEFLIGSSAFMDRLTADMAAAGKRILVQAMTLEADAAGQALIRGMRASRAPDRRILVDAYTRHVVNDRFLHTPAARCDRPLMAEARSTRRLMAGLPRSGLAVRVTNPSLGPCLVRYPARNHKKMIIIDRDVCYIGGINFSDHNFRWHDMMIRCRHRGLADFMRRDFDATWQGRNRSTFRSMGDVTAYALDGRRSRGLYARIFDRIAASRRSIVVHSPYVTPPFLTALQQASAKGVTVTILTPGKNNKPVIGVYLRSVVQGAGMHLRVRRGGMSHLKAMLIDDRCLITGSSNFDVISYHLEQEVLVAIEDAGCITAFKKNVLEPDLSASVPARGRVSSASAMLSRLLMAHLDAGCRLLSSRLLSRPDPPCRAG